MPNCIVKVTGPRNQTLCVNGNYHPDFPQYATYRFEVEAGANRFEALDPTRTLVTHRTILEVAAGDPTYVIELDPLNPPQPRG